MSNRNCTATATSDHPSLGGRLNAVGSKFRRAVGRFAPDDAAASLARVPRAPDF